ncbi:MAG: chemotaxis-specific protein-glutamate methyltransferase CheB [Halovenus sp.]
MADVVVVDDSQFMRVQITEILEDGGHTVVGDASNGKAAIDVVTECEPDVVTMDVKMPGMDGIDAVEAIMDEQPTPVLMLSRYTEEGAETTFEALAAGAVDFMMKPDGEVTTSLVEYAEDLVDLVDVVSRADVSESPATEASTVTPEPGLATTEWESPPTIVIAASTGGPTEIHSIVGSLPGSLGARVLIVQHMPEQFTGRFANRLDELSELAVREAEPGDTVGPNEVLVARGGNHLEVDAESGRELRVTLTDDPPVHSVRPAADVTLQSVAGTVSGPLLTVVLSGMGKDGASGVEAIADAGGKIVVQTPESARISAMPDRAIDTGVVDRIVPTEEIPETLFDVLDSATDQNP